MRTFLRPRLLGALLATFMLSLLAVAPNASASQSIVRITRQLNFDSQPVGTTSAIQLATITNVSSDITVDLDAVYLRNYNGFMIEGLTPEIALGPCVFLVPGSSCSAEIALQPTSTGAVSDRVCFEWFVVLGTSGTSCTALIGRGTL
jgi:hypothetical protein